MKIKRVSDPFRHLAGQPVKTITVDDFDDESKPRAEVIDLASKRNSMRQQAIFKRAES